jgi:ubiquinone/menaquinone biosynthesis C-methylase UbiE
MNEQTAGGYWNSNAEAWSTLARAGYDTYRDHFNTPAFFKILPEIKGLYGLDIGCGEGYNTRLLSQKGARMAAVDISEKFIEKAKTFQPQPSTLIDYKVATASSLPFADNTFDFATSFMCLMDIPDPEQAIQEAFRILKPGCFLQFSITHPCYNTPHRRNLRNVERQTYAIEVGGYFNFLNGEIAEWIFSETPAELKERFGKFQVPVFNRTLSFWVNAVIGAGFIIEKINEPYPDDAMITQYPSLQDAQVVAYFLHVRCRKPADSHHS